MKTVEIVATANKGEKTERVIKVQRQLPTTTDEAVKVYGSVERLLALAEDSFVIAAQQRMRSLAQKTGDDRVSDQAIVADMAKWSPKTRKEADPKAKAEKVTSMVKGMDAKTRAALLKELASIK